MRQSKRERESRLQEEKKAERKDKERGGTYIR